jgi:hypothetical protein
MGAFAVLFLLGILIACIGSIIGIVDAFRESTLWGVLALLVPFALLVFCIKFWNQRKWARNSLIMGLIGFGVTLLSLPMGGLALLRAGNDVDQDLEDFTFEEGPVDPEAQADGEVEIPAEGEDDELFKEAMLPGLPTAAEIARAELLPSTDPNERLKEIDSERADPYAIVTLPPPPPRTPPAPAAGSGNNGQTASPNAGSPPTTTPNGNNQGPGPNNGGTGETAPRPLPELPEPTVVASQVEISGVATVNGDTYVIVKAPGEPTSRYVKVGDRLSNGAVLVKRIENRLSGSPVVVLEERGEEIALPVGANVGVAEEPTAAQPVSTNSIATLPIPNLN